MFIIILFSIIAAVLFELGKNTLLGWGLLLISAAVYIYGRTAFLKQQPFRYRALAFAGYLAVLFLCFLISRPPVRNVPAVAAKNPETTDVITVEQGQLTGVYNEEHTVAVYAGIPYAAPPVGDLRWKEPQDPEPWDGILKADQFAPMSMQETNGPIYSSLYQIIGYHDYKISLDDNYIPPVSEDSLYLNIWTPAGGGTDLPVIVYIHGGSLQTGQPWYSDYSGKGLAEEGVIVVNFGYRLGVFGFYADEELQQESADGTTGNYGLLDQIKALEWVQKNIAAFGGDPENVTLAGESAGSACVSALCTSPLARGLFTRVIMESSTVSAPYPQHSYRTLEEALETGKKLKEDTGCTTVEELRKLPAEQIVSSVNDNHHMTVDGYVLPQSPCEAYRKGEFNETAALHGFNKGESGPFMLFDKTNAANYAERLRATFGDAADEIAELYPASTDAEAKENMLEIFTADWFSHGHYTYTRQCIANDIPVYEYYFTKDNGRLGAWHSGEEVYLYNNIPEKSSLYDETDYELERIFSSYVLNFARTGDPNGEGLPEWKPSDDASVIQELGVNVGPVKDPYVPLYEILDRWMGYEE